MGELLEAHVTRVTRVTQREAAPTPNRIVGVLLRAMASYTGLKAPLALLRLTEIDSLLFLCDQRVCNCACAQVVISRPRLDL
jgi:hypothetical protein